MKRIVHNLPPESAYAGQPESDGGPLIEPVPSRPGAHDGRAHMYRDPDDLFGIWTHCEKKNTTLRTLTRR